MTRSFAMDAPSSSPIRRPTGAGSAKKRRKKMDVDADETDRHPYSVEECRSFLPTWWAIEGEKNAYLEAYREKKREKYYAKLKAFIEDFKTTDDGKKIPSKVLESLSNRTTSSLQLPHERYLALRQGAQKTNFLAGLHKRLARRHHYKSALRKAREARMAREEIYSSDERERLWRSIARKQVPKIARLLSQSSQVKLANARKVALLCGREVRRLNFKIHRVAKESANRSRKSMREMLNFWKRNEKEEREMRKRAEKEAAEKRRVEEEQREARRQAKKLNFLITQTELYSHFIAGKTARPKVKTNEAASELNINVEDLADIDDKVLEAEAERKAMAAASAHRERTKNFDAEAENRRIEAGGEANTQTAADQFDTLNFMNPSTIGEVEIAQPVMLQCKLKSYQLKGLTWLANLYEQGINGILADEMGLGKTVQSIALMAHLAESQNIWGPFLVIAPASTLHNWQQEFTRFVPSLRTLPYWGSVSDRKTLRKFWNQKKLYTRDAPFHVLITSYQLVVSDEQYFQRIQWQYMVLDEAQAIKSSSSIRWKTLLGFHCRNRLLLTGTPIQNSMQELWALLHFIMPSLFDSHDEFSEWFAKDIESHAEHGGALDAHQLSRLHMILKPFMLRRVKKDVENELSDKIEKTLICELAPKQKRMYKAIRDKLPLAELLQKAAAPVNGAVSEGNLDNLMNLVMQFRKVCNHPELFERSEVESPFVMHEIGEIGPSLKEIEAFNWTGNLRNPISLRIPKLFYDENMAGLHLDNYLLREIDLLSKEALVNHDIWTGLLFTPGGRHAVASNLAPSLETLLYTEEQIDLGFAIIPVSSRLITKTPPLVDTIANDPIIPAMKELLSAYLPPVVAATPELFCSDASFTMTQKGLVYDPQMKKSSLGIFRTDEMSMQTSSLPDSDTILNRSILIPEFDKLIRDSGKLAQLDDLLATLKSEGHRVLIYFQMTRMIDLMEEYLLYRRHKYLRLDGSSKISDRRDMVADWQTQGDIFIFLLSTRAGGLGINLTAADTVIFYDSDWNPTVDQQAMDRAHRLGQTKQVTVYRMVTKNTIEERILARAKEKDEIHKVVIAGGEFKQHGASSELRTRDIVSLLLDEDEMAAAVAVKSQLATANETNGVTTAKSSASGSPGTKKRRGKSNGSEPTKRPRKSLAFE